MSTSTQRRPLTNRMIRPGNKVMRLDASKAEGKVRFPWLQKKKKKAIKEKKDTLQHLRRVGAVSMIQIGPDEFRTPNRKERRRAKIRHQSPESALTKLAQSKTRPLRHPVQLGPSVIELEPHVFETTSLGAARRVSAELRKRPYTRKAKLLHKAYAEEMGEMA